MKILTASQMREVDRLTTEHYGIPSLLLMENAGRGVVEAMREHYGDLKSLGVTVLCGKGNNGGDGFVVARHLIMQGCQPQVLLFASPEEIKGDARINFEILQKMNACIRVIDAQTCTGEQIQRILGELDNDLIVDALLGTGVRLPLGPPWVDVIQSLKKFRRVVAVDIPSGLSCEDLNLDKSLITAAQAELTVTFSAVKPPHVFYPGATYVGKCVTVSIGSPQELLERNDHWLNAVSDVEAALSLRRLARPADSHKGNFGHVLVIAGSLGKTGAAVMTAKSALLAGAGLVTLATASPCLPIIASQSVEIMTESLEATESGSISAKAFDYGRINELVKGKELIALGPGIGTGVETRDFVRRIVAETTFPLVLDADGINAFEGCSHLLRGEKRELVLTPHPGEFARLVGKPTSEILNSRIEISREFATAHHAHLVLKGHRTIYASPSGQVYVNLSGNPGMATGGSGDVLTGIIAGLMGQGIAIPERVPQTLDIIEELICLGVFLHGYAGDLAANQVGQQSLIAGDIMGFIPEAFLNLEKLIKGQGPRKAYRV